MGWTNNYPNFVGNYDRNEKDTIHIGHSVYSGIEKPANARVCSLPESSHRMGS